MKSNAKYHFGRLRRHWGIWDNTGSKVMDVFSFEEAVRQTYLLNGWQLKKEITHKF